MNETLFFHPAQKGEREKERVGGLIGGTKTGPPTQKEKEKLEKR